MGDKTVGRGAKLEDSNLSAYGSKEHKDAKLNAAKTEKAWEGCGQKVGIEIWRVEKFKIKHWPKDQYGKFFEGDAYIVLHTYEDMVETKDGGDKEKKILYNVHFWLGAESSQDEQGVAAYKTVELDDLLGDLPVQFREVQGDESEEFLDLFPKGIKLMKGGIESGFNKVKPEEYKARLLHVKGKKRVTVTEVKLDIKSLNPGDAFVVDNGLMVYSWNGPKAGMFEKRKTAEVVKSILDERNGKAKKEVVDGLEDHPEFWKIFGLDKTPSADDMSPITPDNVKVDKKITLIHVSDESGHLKREIVEGPVDKKTKLSKEKLKSDDVMILDCWGHRIWVWIGKGASKRERSQGCDIAKKYAQEKGYNVSKVQITRVTEGREPKGWKTHF